MPPVSTGASQPSQSIQFNSVNSSSAPIQSTMNLDSSGNFTLTPPSPGTVLVSGPLNMPPVSTGASQPSQSIQFNSVDSSSAPLQSTVNLDSSGNFTLAPPSTGAVLVNGPLNVTTASTSAFNIASKFNVTGNGLVNQYFGTSLLLHGLPATVGVGHTAGTDMGDTETVLMSTLTSVNSEYRINYYLYQTAAGTGCGTSMTSVTLAINFTDLVPATRVATLPPLTITGNANAPANSISGSIPIISAAGMAITYTTTYMAGACTTLPRYGAYVWAEAM